MTLCYRPEDGLRCPQGVKPPLKKKGSGYGAVQMGPDLGWTDDEWRLEGSTGAAMLYKYK